MPSGIKYRLNKMSKNIFRPERDEIFYTSGATLIVPAGTLLFICVGELQFWIIWFPGFFIKNL